MIPTTTPPPRSIDNSAIVDRAVANADTVDRNAAANLQKFLSQPREPLNRRARRYFAAEVRRSERRMFRGLIRQECEERAASERAGRNA
jgi:hypothetical protein